MKLSISGLQENLSRHTKQERRNDPEGKKHFLVLILTEEVKEKPNYIWIYILLALGMAGIVV